MPLIRRHARRLSYQAALLKKFALELGKPKAYVLIGKTKRKDGAALFLKGLFDLKLPYKYIVPGSGSLESKQKIPALQVGRKHLFELSTIIFE